MPKHGADLSKRRSATKHLGGCGVPQQMSSSTSWTKSRTPDGASYRVANAQT
jgi:hypothetical protein